MNVYLHKALILSSFLLFAFGSNAQVKILFDATKAETAGSANWVIDADLHNLFWSNRGTVTATGTKANAQQIPTPAQNTVNANTIETYWEGALSSWAIDCVNKGYIVESLPYTGKITYGNSSNTQDLSKYNVFVVCEPNIKFTDAEKTAMLSFVNAGGGLFIISDHAGSDRNNDGFDSPTIWNDFFNNNSVKINPFGISFDTTNPNGGAYPSDMSQITSKLLTTANPITKGTYGTCTKVKFNGGTSMVINTNANSTVKGVAFATQSAVGNTSGVLCAYATYGKGKIVAIGDSSPCDDGTGAPGITLYVSYKNEPSVGDNHRFLFMNATIWLATSTLPVKFVSANGKNSQNNTSISWQADESNMQANNYQIEKSIDGKHFFAAATIASKNQTIGIANYTWSVKDNIEAPVYYRIGVNENGVFSYSSTITINPSSTKATIKIYPNPSPAHYAGIYTIESVTIGNTVVIRNEIGKVCFQNKANSNTVQWNGNDKSAQKTPSGLYFVSIMNNESGEEKIVGRISK